MSLYRSAADRREQSQQREQGPPPHQVGSRLGPNSGHCTYRSATGYIWVTAWLPASGMRLNLKNVPIEMLLDVFKTRPQCCRVCGSPYEHCTCGNASCFESPSIFLTRESRHYLRCKIHGPTNTVSWEPQCPIWNSRSNHYCLRCEPHCPTIPVSDLNLTPASLCALGRRAGCQLRQWTVAERWQRGGP